MDKRRQKRQFTIVSPPQPGIRVEHHADDNAEEEHACDKLLADRNVNGTHCRLNIRWIVTNPQQRVDTYGSEDNDRK